MTCNRVFIVSIGYKAVSTTTPAVPPAITPSVKSSIRELIKIINEYKKHIMCKHESGTNNFNLKDFLYIRNC